MSDNKLALAHWEYVQGVIEVHMPEPTDPELANVYSREEVIAIARHHYLTAWTHAVKHEREAQKDTAREAMQPLPESVTEPKAAATCAHYDGTFCLFYSSMGADFHCYRCLVYERKAASIAPSPLAPVFALITEEYHRSLAEHTPWEEAGHSADTMLKVIKAEVAEVELALSMGDHDEAVKELVHVGNVAVKAIAELTRRGRL